MNLTDLKPFLDDVIDSFAAVLDLELTIINAQPMTRVSGTGKFKSYENQSWESTYTWQVIKSGKSLFVLDTSGDSFAINEGKNTYYSLILYPIILHQRTEGVIVLASFTEIQQDALIHNQRNLFNYMEKTASLISAKLDQERLMELAGISNAQLSEIFESVNSGLILYTEGGIIQQINSHAKRLLLYDDPSVTMPNELYCAVQAVAEEALFRQQIVERHINQHYAARNISLIVQARPIKSNSTSAVCVIKTFQELQNTITQNDNESFPTYLVTCNSEMLALKARIEKVAQNNSNVLILGESGTGKELVARAIHQASPRRQNPFVTVNCAAIPETLLESELFGYEDGAFTGAKKGGRLGKFMLANTGTLFLDEIGDMPLYLQAKLLRVLSDRHVDRIGSRHPVMVDVHIISATNKNLEEMITKKEFREDLYYRLSVIPVWIPPLRERREDILLLANYFIEKYNQKLNRHVSDISPEVKALLMKYRWPGNVRELENCIEYMVNFEQDQVLTVHHVPQRIQHGQKRVLQADQSLTAPEYFNENMTLRQMVRGVEMQALKQMNAQYGNKPSLRQIREICGKLGISVASYYRKMEDFGSGPV